MIRIIPQPSSVKESGGICENEADITKSVVEALGAEEYRLTVTKSGISLSAGSDAGLFYAEKTLEQLKVLCGGKIPCCEIKDRPRFDYRGFMIDCARHTFPVAQLKKMIDAAALFKMNVFHWHLSDDQGFRIALDGTPELTEKSTTRRCDRFGTHIISDEPYGGCFTKAEIREVIEYCKERFITVIPELDLPGHTSAILHAHPELSCKGEPVEIKVSQGIYKDIFCAGNPDTYTFLKKIIDELCELFPAPYFHIGGDEAPGDNWQSCEKCRAEMARLGIKNTHDYQCLFANRIAEMLIENGKTPVCWNDILKGDGLDDRVVIQRWMDTAEHSVKAANGGRKMIASNFSPYYLDYPYSSYPLKKVYSFEPATRRLSETGRQNLIGTEAPLWTEYVNTNERMEYLCLPRWLAVAESAWSTPENKDYRLFHKVCYTLCDALLSDYKICPEAEADPRPLPRLREFIRFYTGIIPRKEK